MADYDLLTVMGIIGSIGTAIATITLVFLIWKTVKQLDETVKLSRIQTNYRFRPWVGPLNRIEFLSSKDGRDQFSITIKNYGEIPSPSVIAKYLVKNEPPRREVLKSEEVTSFNLGPLLPNMEKRYWFFIDSDLIQKTKTGNAMVFIFLYFQYEYPGGSSGYGLISRYDSVSNSFVHIDMWVD